LKSFSQYAKEQILLNLFFIIKQCLWSYVTIKNILMKIYTLAKTQNLPISLEEAWDFFSSPKNLKEITPPYMGFVITSDLGDGKMYSGQIISYKVTPLLNIPMTWVTEIKHVEDHKYFVDEQRFGPYALWHHQHWFKSIDGGVEMRDIVNYGLPLDPLGRIGIGFVRSKLEEIFDYRFHKVEQIFGKYGS
jgi:ligand-binding SRPBCC domain-containing protein